MILYAVVLTLCTIPQSSNTINDQCDSYVIALDDAWKTKRQCVNHGLRLESEHFANVWRDDQDLSDYLAQYGISTKGQTITDYDFTCVKVD